MADMLVCGTVTLNMQLPLRSSGLECVYAYTFLPHLLTVLLPLLGNETHALT